MFSWINGGSEKKMLNVDNAKKAIIIFLGSSYTSFIDVFRSLQLLTVQNLSMAMAKTRQRLSACRIHCQGIDPFFLRSSREWSFTSFETIYRGPRDNGRHIDLWMKGLERIIKPCGNGCFTPAERDHATTAKKRYKVSHLTIHICPVYRWIPRL